MTDTDEPDHIKVLVPLGAPFDPDTPESMWAIPLDEADRCEIRNTPWDAYGLNWGDVVRIETPASGDLPEVLEVVEPSGHRTIRVMFNTDLLEPDHVQAILEELDAADASHEHASGRLYGIDVPPSADYDAVAELLVGHHDAGRLIFEEAWKGPSLEEQGSPDWL